MRFPISKYKASVKDNKVYVESTYAGKKVEAHASCAPSDNFDFDTGLKLAALRCNVKVARKRMLRAQAKAKEAQETMMIVLHDFRDALKYQVDTSKEYSEALKELSEFEKKLKG